MFTFKGGIYAYKGMHISKKVKENKRKRERREGREREGGQRKGREK